MGSRATHLGLGRGDVQLDLHVVAVSIVVQDLAERIALWRVRKPELRHGGSGSQHGTDKRELAATAGLHLRQSFLAGALFCWGVARNHEPARALARRGVQHPADGLGGRGR